MFVSMKGLGVQRGGLSWCVEVKKGHTVRDSVKSELKDNLRTVSMGTRAVAQNAAAA